jgi:Rrf2 family protein
MIEIASDTSTNGVFQKDIAKNQEISNKYLDHIISGLKAANLISNVKGKKSGYILTKEASEISIFEIHNAFENGICVIDCVNFNYQCEKSGKCKPQQFWKGLNKVVLDYFQNTTLLDILNYEL